MSEKHAHGKQVKATIEHFYIKKKGYSKEHADKIAGAVAAEEHMHKKRAMA